MKITIKIDDNSNVVAIADEVGDVGFEKEIFEVSDQDAQAYCNGEATARLEGDTIVFSRDTNKKER